MLQIITAIIEFIVGVILYITGEIILFIVTLGKHKIIIKDWNKSKAIEQMFFEVSVYIGLAFWVGVSILVNNYFHKTY